MKYTSVFALNVAASYREARHTSWSRAKCMIMAIRWAFMDGPELSDLASHYAMRIGVL